MLHVSERATRFGDGLFETIRVESATPLHLSLHLKRLSDGLNALRIPTPAEDIASLCQQLITRNQLQQGMLRLSVSRGIGSVGYLPTGDHPPTVVIEVMARAETPSPAAPITLWLSSTRRLSLASLPTQYKLAQGLNATLARIEAAEHGADEALLLSEAGMVSECSSANIFWLSNGVLHTPALTTGALAGITRARLIAGWDGQLRQGEFPLSSLMQAQAIIITNSLTGARAVARILPENTLFNSGQLAERANKILHEQDKDAIISGQTHLHNGL